MPEPDGPLGAHYLETTRQEFLSMKRLGEKALAQVKDDSHLHTCLDAESNSLAILIQHIAGNMRSRWTDFLTSDGEKPDRQRDAEFVAEQARSRADLMELWERGWSCLVAAMDALGPRDLERKVVIRGASLTVLQALSRQLAHYSQHVGQMVFLAKHLEHESWQSLSMPRRK